jgi:hypothetical protein
MNEPHSSEFEEIVQGAPSQDGREMLIWLTPPLHELPSHVAIQRQACGSPLWSIHLAQPGERCFGCMEHHPVGLDFCSNFDGRDITPQRYRTLDESRRASRELAKFRGCIAQ